MKHFLTIVFLLLSFSIFAQKKDKKKPPATIKLDTVINLEPWAINDLNALEAETQKMSKQLTDTQTYLQVLQIRKEDITRTIFMSDKGSNRPPLDKISKLERVGNTIVLTLKRDTVKSDTVKIKP